MPARILVVDDERNIQLTLSRALSMEGYTVEVAGGGNEALERIAATPVDLVVMDVRMPDLDGIEATRRLRASGLRTPIIALTADVLDRRDQYIDGGYTDEFAKPVEIDDLTARIAALLAASR